MTYDDLIALTSNWADRADAAALNATFVSMAEGEMAFLRTRQMVSREEVSVELQYTELPGDFLAERSFRLEIPDKELEFKTAEELDQLFNDVCGTPVFYTVVDGRFRFWPTPDQAQPAYLTYYRALTPFTPETRNWIADEFPNAYRFGVLWACAMWRKDPEDIALYRGQFDNTLSAIQSRFGDKEGKTLTSDDSLLQAVRNSTLCSGGIV